jgi:uncharacterized DUF497 family protein
MRFDYDYQKSDSNRKKHGIDFDEAKKIWKGRIVEIPARDSGENRMLVIGKIGENIGAR